MNNKQQELYRLVDIAVECCDIDFNNTHTVTKELLLSSNRKECLVMSRCVLVALITHCGYSTSTAAVVLNRTEPEIRKLKSKSFDYNKQSKAYRIALAEAILKANNEKLDNN